MCTRGALVPDISQTRPVYIGAKRQSRVQLDLPSFSFSRRIGGRVFLSSMPLPEVQVLACLSRIIRILPKEDVICTTSWDNIGNYMCWPVANLSSLWFHHLVPPLKDTQSFSWDSLLTTGTSGLDINCGATYVSATEARKIDRRPESASHREIIIMIRGSTYRSEEGLHKINGQRTVFFEALVMMLTWATEHFVRCRLDAKSSGTHLAILCFNVSDFSQ